MNSNPLAEIDILEVARIAASIATPNLQPIDKIREAYQLLEIADRVRRVSSETGFCLSAVLKDLDNPDAISPLAVELDAINARIIWEGEGLASFAVCLKELMPSVTKTAVRKGRFLDFLVSPEGEGLTRQSADLAIARHEKEGVLFGEFQYYFQIFRLWWEFYKNGVKSKAGQSKGNQGRVVRKNDKRKGSRAGSFLKALKKHP
jgi:hypothetical protein